MSGDSDIELSTDFTKTAIDQESDNRILNYVWINKEAFNPNKTGAPCGVPLHYLDRAIGNAEKYSGAQVKIWLDFGLLDDTTIEIVKQHISSKSLKNIEIHDLHEIEAFAKSDLFDPDRDISKLRDLIGAEDDLEKHNIWGRVDLARLMVINHCFQNTNAQDVFYSDFDIEDTALDSKNVAECLLCYGMVFGSSKPGIIENGYMGFNRVKLNQGVFERVLTETEVAVRAGYNGYGPFYQALRKYSEEHAVDDFSNTLSILVAPPMRYVIPENPKYHGVCIA